MNRFIALLLIISLLITLGACSFRKENGTTAPLNPQTGTTVISPETSGISPTEPGSLTETPQTTHHAGTSRVTSPPTSPVDATVSRPTQPASPGGTYTGRPALPLKDFSSFDPNNKKGLPTKKIAHAYGVAKDGKPHSISVESQAFFEAKGYNAITYDTKSAGKVLYLTFDCGYENGYTSKILDTLKQKGVKAAFFCTLPQVKENPDLTARMINEGHILGNHSNSHPSFPSISRTQMAKELQSFDDYVRTKFGYSAPFFRFPMGEYSESALDLVASLGFKSVFWSVAYSDWDVNSQKGKTYAFETVTARIHPGAVILLHSVSSDNAAALGDIIDWAQKQGYTFRSLA